MYLYEYEKLKMIVYNIYPIPEPHPTAHYKSAIDPVFL